MRNRPVIDNYTNKLQIENLPIASLKPSARNPRTHSPKQIEQIGRSIREFGFTNPVLIGPDRGVIAGHGRIEAAKLLGIGEVPTIRLDHMTEAQKRAYVIADNRLAENAGWDRELLALELQYLSDLDLNFDATITGFDTPEIDVLIQGIDLDGTSDRADEVPEIDESVPPVSRVEISGNWATIGCSVPTRPKQNHSIVC
jgi:ParB-like chromosome segregation protein Spo0J